MRIERLVHFVSIQRGLRLGSALTFILCLSSRPSMAEPLAGAASTQPVIGAGAFAKCEGDRAGRIACLKAALLELRAEMFTPGTDEQIGLRARVQSLLATDDAVREFIELYGEAPRDEHWDLLRLAGLVARKDAVQFLAREAIRELPHEQHASTGSASDAPCSGADSESQGVAADLRDAMTAGKGVVDALSVKIDGATTALNSILEQADPAVAQVIAVELFSRGLLTAAHRQKLSERGIFAQFRRFTPAERDAVLAVKPAARAAANASRPSASSMPVPQTSSAIQPAPQDGAPTASPSTR